MERSTVSDIKRAQKEKLLLREISKLFAQASMDDPALHGLTITKTQLSPDKGLVSVYFYCPEGIEHFETILDRLKLYKPSMRTALAHSIRSRYTPELRFRFDVNFEKQERLEKLLDQVKNEEEE
jgi:ribosome-binding factor A